MFGYGEGRVLPPGAEDSAFPALFWPIVALVALVMTAAYWHHRRHLRRVCAALGTPRRARYALAREATVALNLPLDFCKSIERDLLGDLLGKPVTRHLRLDDDLRDQVTTSQPTDNAQRAELLVEFGGKLTKTIQFYHTRLGLQAPPPIERIVDVFLLCRRLERDHGSRALDPLGGRIDIVPPL